MATNMYCEHCGNKLEQGHKFCTKCGHSSVPAQTQTAAAQQPGLSLGDKWWHRLLKVLYVIAYLPLLGIVPAVWMSNAESCYNSSYSGYTCYGSDGEAFWYSLLTLVIYMVVLRLIKVSVLYIAFGQRPQWKREFKKLF
ncbi:MAG: zinc ribbon domain-containing protein [Minisyncoccota bacterium]